MELGKMMRLSRVHPNENYSSRKKRRRGQITVSILLHEAFRHAGKSVSILDWDAQATSNKALDLIVGKEREKANASDIVIYDTPPNLEHTATATAVRSADIVLV